MSRLKIQISYIGEEAKEAAAAVAALRAVLPGINPRYKDKHLPRKHIYITIPESKENT